MAEGGKTVEGQEILSVYDLVGLTSAMDEGGKTVECPEILNVYVLVSLSYGRGWEDRGGPGDPHHQRLGTTARQPCSKVAVDILMAM